jgi:signal transduction histidine kinase
MERCLRSKGKESTETTWRRKDGTRLLVRLSACAISSDLIEAGVEDLTPIRALNDRLSQAHRMEAVGRLAIEVAVTCGSLLSSVHQNAQQLLMTDDSNPASRYRSEMLLEEISRAAGLLRQLAAYSDEEGRQPAMVELRTVLRDVAPVLKRVAGDGVEVQLPAASAPLNVDAGAERIQRLLVNLAAYGRERMPLGGRLKIELSRIVVDRHFAAKHPNARLGPHALITVTGSRRATRTDGPVQLHDNDAGSNSGSVSIQTGVDLGTLQELVAECGGHLWMTVEPVGDMVVKIRLPLVTSYGEPPRRTSALGGRVRTLGRLTGVSRLF